jgi:hypothetical protein
MATTILIAFLVTVTKIDRSLDLFENPEFVLLLALAIDVFDLSLLRILILTMYAMFFLLNLIAWGQRFL